MDDQNKGLNERWAEPDAVPERGYAADIDAVAGSGAARATKASDRRTAEIRSEIEQTRAEMTETIDAIQDKLRPGTLAAQATGSVKRATVGKVKEMADSARQSLGEYEREWEGRGNALVERIRENPIPVAIAAASIAWLAFSGRRNRRPEVSPAIYGTTRSGEPFLRETVISEDLGHVHNAYDAEYDGGRTVRDRAGEVAGRAQEALRGTGERVRRATAGTQTRVQRLVRENPLAAGAIAAAVGATVGFALPETRRENELMGEAREKVVNQAQEAARGAAERVQGAAQRVQDVAADAARSATRTE